MMIRYVLATNELVNDYFNLVSLYHRMIRKIIL
jgi:hypothetical protein